jgi:TRAP-type C4-dicarboxylate transport system substrate-binding protein
MHNQKEDNMKVKKLIVCLVSVCLLFSVSTFFLMASEKEDVTATTEPIVLKAVSFGPLSHNNAAPLKKFMDRIDAQSDGMLKIEYLGASEVVPLYDMPEALRTGVFDLLIIFPAAYVGILPIVGGMNLGDLNPPEWHKSGAHDFLVETHKTANMMYLGSFAAYEDGSYLFFKKRISKPEDLAGMNFASGPTNLLSIAAWGGSGVRVPMAEKYSALERGIVDGVAGVLASHYKDSLFEVTKYWVPYSLGSAMTSMLMNLDSWNEIPADLQDMVAEIMLELEEETVEILKAGAQENIRLLKDEGMEMIEFSPAVAERFLEVSLDAQWAAIEEKVDPSVVSKLKKMLNK